MEMEKGMKWQWEDSRPDGGGRGETLSICAWAGGTTEFHQKSPEVYWRLYLARWIFSLPVRIRTSGTNSYRRSHGLWFAAPTL